MRLFKISLIETFILVVLASLAIALAPSIALAEVTAEDVLGTNVETISEEDGVLAIHSAWTSNATGQVTTHFYRVFGTLERVVINPGSTAPTASYDMVVEDRDAVDILGGSGANLSATVTTNFVPLIGTVVESATDHARYIVGGTLSLKITNAGASKVGTVALYFKK